MTDIRDEEDITTLVHAFYAKIEDDERLGHIFNEVADVDWDEHLPKMVDFWSKMLFRTERYKGRPFREHLLLPIERDDFGRWVGLFTETVDEHFEGNRADYAKELAVNIANSFSTRMAMDGKFDQNSED
ncbi:sec-independent protein translocase TatC [Aliifodinibius salipaludis]|uniref:Sec-independent protein translocase TatC n=1 Tax=Fodinibius salipaludis TaxID=2032627 RepID=A0A2A2G8T8_9BACT|nr:group III truncated hemoglobin [Aliifodinibius salipaludis]PAU93265.1 sec-independent protein translocase TatC [Aliifodinibius salipaludis]